MKTRATLTLMLSTGAMLAAMTSCAARPAPAAPRLTPVAQDGFSGSSINTVIFRRSALVTFGQTQYTAYYDNDARVVLARRKLGQEPWQVLRTELTGTIRDAHNTISLGIDGTGILHVAWDHHGNALNYVRTVATDSLELTARMPMDSVRETRVTYPEFYSLPGGDLLMLYRDGASGSGDLVLKKYQTARKTWTTVAQNLVAGEGRQNAYPQFTVGPDGTLHLGWVWRRTSDVATNHDLCYARSKDGGRTWTDSAGKTLDLPITAATCEVALRIPERSDLINQTTIAGDAQGRPYIATYFRRLDEPSPGVPQFQVIYHDGTSWKTSQVGKRTLGFSLAGGGTRRIPISRPLIVVDGGSTASLARTHVVYRDEERGERVTLATCSDLAKGDWTLMDLTQESVGAWEPSHDPLRWVRDGVLDLFVQKTQQVSGSDSVLRAAPPTGVFVLEYKP